MTQKSDRVDVEAQLAGGRRRGDCLDVFLTTSVVLLFAAVSALSVGGLLMVKELRSELRHPSSSQHGSSEKHRGEPPAPALKMQNFAFLEPKPSDLNNLTMRWDVLHYDNGMSVGSNFLFDKSKHSLEPIQDGSYFIYIEANVSCTHKCKSGLLSLNVGDKLECDVHLREGITSVRKKCWTVAQLKKGEGLITQMEFTIKESHWKLEPQGSGLGTFLVD